MENSLFAGLEIPTFTIDNLVGRRVDILAVENDEGKIIVARDVKTKDGFVLFCEVKSVDNHS